MLPFFVFLLYLPSGRGDCPRPFLPQRMVIDFTNLKEGNGSHLATHFPTGTRAHYRCHEKYNDFNPAAETICCQEDGNWWPQYVPNFCANELKTSMTGKELPSGKSYDFPLHFCLGKSYSSLQISLGGLYKLNHFAIMSERDTLHISIRLVVKENGLELFKEAIIIEGLVAGEEKLIDTDLPEITHVIINTPFPLCSFRAAILDPTNPSKCLPSLAGSPEAGRISEVSSPKRIKFSCDFDSKEQVVAICDEIGLWSPIVECSAPKDIHCGKNSILTNYGEFTCNLEHFVLSSSHECYCDSLGGFVRHPDGLCVQLKDCPDGDQRNCAEFEELVLHGVREEICGEKSPPHSISSPGFRCQCKPRLVRMLSTGKCVLPERCVLDDKRESTSRKEFDLNCDNSKTFYNYGDFNYGFCDQDLFRTRRGHCVKKEFCPTEWGSNWIIKLLGMGSGWK